MDAKLRYLCKYIFRMKRNIIIKSLTLTIYLWQNFPLLIKVVPVILEICYKLLCFLAVKFEKWGRYFFTTDGLEEPVAVGDKVIKLLDVAPGPHRLAVALIINSKHTIPCCGQLDPTCCQEAMFPTIRQGIMPSNIFKWKFDTIHSWTPMINKVNRSGFKGKKKRSVWHRCNGIPHNLIHNKELEVWYSYVYHKIIV